MPPSLGRSLVLNVPEAFCQLLLLALPSLVLEGLEKRDVAGYARRYDKTLYPPEKVWCEEPLLKGSAESFLGVGSMQVIGLWFVALSGQPHRQDELLANE